MRPLRELLSIDNSQLTELEVTVKTYLNVDTQNKAIQKARKLSLTDIKEGLSVYNSVLTEDLWKSSVTLKNVKAYLTSEDFKETAINFIKESDDFKLIKGSYDVATSTFKAEDALVGSAISELNPTIIEKDISRLKKISDSLDADVSKVKAFLKRDSSLSFELSLDDEKQEFPEWLSKVAAPVPAMIVVAAMFPAVAQADDHSSRAVNAAAKATLMHTGLDKQAEAFGKIMAKKAEAAINEAGARMPAAVVGFGLKTVAEGKLALKGRNPVMEGKYELSISPSDAQVKITDNQEVSYWLKSKMSNETRVEIGVNFEF